MPADLRYVRDTLYLDIDGNTNNRRQVERVSARYIEKRRQYAEYSSWPNWWAWSENGILVYPSPDTANHVFRFRGTADFPAPRAAYVNAVWEFEEDEWTSPWLEHAPDLVRHTALWLFYRDILTDNTRASAAYAAKEEAKRSLTAQQEDEEMSDVNDPWPDLNFYYG